MDTISLLVGRSRSITLLRASCTDLASWGLPIALVGPTGCGKTLIAREIHRHLPPTAPFERLSASGLTRSLLYGELFGNEAGAYTGADRWRAGILASLRDGVLFLDDIQDLKRWFQRVLLDIVEGEPLRRLGADRPFQAAVRIIVGSQLPLEHLWRLGLLREDLFERLNGVTIEVPPLKERTEDIPDLCDHVLRRVGKVLRRPVPQLEPMVVAALQRHTWPRNVRELVRVLERSAFEAYRECPHEPLIEVRHLPVALQALSGGRPRRVRVSAADAVSMVQRTGSAEAAAPLLNVTPRTVYRRLKEVRRKAATDSSARKH